MTYSYDSKLEATSDVETTKDEGAKDNRTNRTKKVFAGQVAGCLKMVEESADLVGRHECLGEFVVVLEVDPPGDTENPAASKLSV